jgi:heptosyltransferase III
VETILDRLPRNSRVAILRLRSLGDSVLTTPAIRILKQARPDLEIAVVVEDRFRAIFEDNPDIGLILPPEPGPLRQWRPVLCLNLHGGTRSMWLTVLSGARYRAAFAHFRHQFVYNIRIPRAQEILGVERKVHTAEHLASAMFFLGAPLTEIPRAKLFAGPARRECSPGACTVIHPVAAAPDKTWPAEGFLRVAQHVREPVFIGGPGENLSRFDAHRTLVGASLAEIKQLLSGAALFIGNDSGPAHMAAAFGLPVVVIFGSSDPDIWSPWRTMSEMVTSPGGIAAVEPSQVLDAIARLRVLA